MESQTLEEYMRERIKQKGKMTANEAKPGKPKQERMVTRTVSNAKGEEVVYYNILYGFGRQDVLEKLYHYEQEEEEANERSIRGNRERVVVESKDGELIATITENEISFDPEFQVRMKPTIPKHKLFISCPMKGRTEENIKKSFEVLKRTAEAYTGENLEVVNPYEPKTFESDADRIRSMGDSIKLIADADYFITVDRFWEHTECGVEDQIAGGCGVKRMLAMTEFAAPDVLEKSKNLVRNPYYNG